MNELIEITKKLKVARKAKGLSQKDVAKYIGVVQARYSNIESKTGRPTTSQGLLLSELLDIDVNIFRKEKTRYGNDNGSFIHGETNTKIYKLWQGMKQRCTLNKNNYNYKYYSGRGIIVTSKWFNSYFKFRDWAYENGYKEGLEIDRINNDGNYEPNNCRFVTRTENNNNKRNNNNLTINGETHTATEWGRICGLTYDIIRQRIKRGDKGERLITPLRHKPKTFKSNGGLA